MNFNWDENPDLNITPLVDIMLVLMAILMVTAPVMEYQDDISLPQGSTAKATHKIPDLTLRIDDKRTIFLKDKKYAFDTFADDFVLNSEKFSKDTVVYIKADKDLKYDDVMFILKVVKDSGFSKVSLVTNG
ncbi:MAG: biopolymer transporter ExbD [Epsilonproteobacteria bacterium]|nr:biopolymer transporter ExbD [Campylobacterota bacterium]